MEVTPPVTLDLEFMLAMAALLAIVPALVACRRGRRLVVPVLLSYAFAVAGVVLVVKTAFPAFCGVVVWIGGSIWVAIGETRKRQDRERLYGRPAD
jgi:D-alanyl-lipoteichoic acid acyltransferase DltB (MBOAT superfamily)